MTSTPTPKVKTTNPNQEPESAPNVHPTDPQPFPLTPTYLRKAFSSETKLQHRQSCDPVRSPLHNDAIHLSRGRGEVSARLSIALLGDQVKARAGKLGRPPEACPRPLDVLGGLHERRSVEIRRIRARRVTCQILTACTQGRDERFGDHFGFEVVPRVPRQLVQRQFVQ